MDSYEKKYKEMKARVLEIGQGYVKGVDFSKPRQIAEYIDPEIVESEDERIRTALLNHLKKMWGNANDDVCGVHVEDVIAWLEKQGEQEIKKKPIWKHWKNGIAGNGEGKQIYLIKSGDSYTLSSCLGYECDYIDLSDLDEFMLSEKQGEQKPAWSEEDEQLIDEVVVCLRKYAEKVQGGYSKSYVQSLADRIESLRPGNTCKATEWSEEDEAMFQGVIETEQYMLDVVYGRKIFAVGNEDIKEECTKELAWLNSLRPKKQWKPSEEQLRELENVFSPDTDSWDEGVLRKLYEQLKRL